MGEFEEVYRSHYKDVYKFLYFTCGKNHSLAEELTQETFYEAFRCYHKYDSSCSVTTWLCAIGKNLWFHYLRKNKGIPVDYSVLSEMVSNEPDSDPMFNVERDEVCLKVRKAIASLKPRYREIVWLRSIAELPFSRIAEIMNISENSAKVLFFRAKNQIKEKLESEGYF